MPTLIGWESHAAHWRGADAVAGRRRAAARIYALGTVPGGAALARAWGVTHVYAGREEARAYGTDVHGRFRGWLAVLEAHGPVVFAVPP